MRTPFRRYSTVDLRRQGLSPSAIRAAVRSGAWVRMRRGVYVPPGTPVSFVRAAELGGRLDCVSLLRECGVFVAEQHDMHLQFDRKASRLPPRHGVTAHWRDTDAPWSDLACGMLDALAQSCRCQPPRFSVASIDSAWHQGFIDREHIDELFTRLPMRYRPLRRLLDPRAESGTETLVRLMLRSLGVRYLPQAEIRSVGRVDFLVEKWLIVECDSVEFHADPRSQRRDRRRDLAAATLGYVTIRLLAEDILYRPEVVRSALSSLLAAEHRPR